MSIAWLATCAIVGALHKKPRSGATYWAGFALLILFWAALFDVVPVLAKQEAIRPRLVTANLVCAESEPPAPEPAVVSHLPHYEDCHSWQHVRLKLGGEVVNLVRPYDAGTTKGLLQELVKVNLLPWSRDWCVPDSDAAPRVTRGRLTRIEDAWCHERALARRARLNADQVSLQDYPRPIGRGQPSVVQENDTDGSGGRYHGEEHRRGLELGRLRPLVGLGGAVVLSAVGYFCCGFAIHRFKRGRSWPPVILALLVATGAAWEIVDVLVWGFGDPLPWSLLSSRPYH